MKIPKQRFVRKTRTFVTYYNIFVHSLAIALFVAHSVIIRFDCISFFVRLVSSLVASKVMKYFIRVLCNLVNDKND